MKLASVDRALKELQNDRIYRLSSHWFNGGRWTLGSYYQKLNIIALVESQAITPMCPVQHQQIKQDSEIWNHPLECSSLQDHEPGTNRRTLERPLNAKATGSVTHRGLPPDPPTFWVISNLTSRINPAPAVFPREGEIQLRSIRPILGESSRSVNSS